MPLTPAEALAEIQTDGGLLHDIVHGPATGSGSLVTTEAGDVPTVSRMLGELGLKTPLNGPVRLATAAALPACTYAAGTAGVGATLTATGNGALTIDGSVVAVGDRILVRHEGVTFDANDVATISDATKTPHNMIAVVTAAGDGSHPFVLTRTPDCDEAAELANICAYVTAGTANIGKVYNLPLTLGAIIVGTTGLIFHLTGGLGGVATEAATRAAADAAITALLPIPLPKNPYGYIWALVDVNGYVLLAVKTDNTFVWNGLATFTTLVTQIQTAASEASVASRVSQIAGVDPMGWTAGLDLAWDFTTGLKYGAAVDFTDTHAAAILMRSASGQAVSKAANVRCQEYQVGHLIVPSRTELVSDAPNAISALYTTQSGTGSIAKDRRDPLGVANKAWTITDADAVNASARQHNYTVANDSATRVAVVFIRKLATTPAIFPSVFIGYTGGTAKNSRLTIDPQTGLVTVLNPSNASWFVESWGDYWMVAGAIANNTTGNTTYFHQLTPARAGTLTTSADGTVTGGHAFTWPNVQVADFPVPPILSQITAGGNVVSVDQTAYAGIGVLGLVTVNIKDPGAGSVRIIALDDGTANNYLAIEHNAGRATVKLVSGGVSQAAVDIGPWRKGRQTIAFAAGTNFVWGQFVRGPAIAPDTAATLPSLTKLGLGGLTGDFTERRAHVVIEKLGLRYDTVDAEGVVAMYNRAVLAHGAVPGFWDTFDRANGAVGTSPSGHDWSQVTAGGVKVTAAISGKSLVATDSGLATTAAYSAIDFGRTPSKIRAHVSFGAGNDGGSAALINTHTLDTADINHIAVDGSLHMVFSNTQCNVGIYLANVLSAVAIINYPTPLAKDGTVYTFGYDISGETLTFIVPNMAPVVISDKRFLLYQGRYVTFEHFWSTGQCQPSFRDVEVA
ncbi:MAG: hypothetical protein WDN08_05255 [Rhizomicrobium sp.]